MSRRSKGRGALAAFLTTLVAVGGLMVTSQGPASADVNQVSGSAYALSLNALGLINIPPTPAGVAGSANEVTNSYDTGLQVAVPVNVPGVLSVGVLEAQSLGGDVTGDNHFGFAESDARAGNVVLGNIILPALQAQVIRSECRSDGTGSTGLTEIIGGTTGGTPIVQTPAANTPLIIGNILAPIATAILNEQTVVNVPGVSTTIVVNAIHITVLPNAILPGLGAIDIVIAQSACAAQGPDVLIPPTTTTAPTTSTTVGPSTTTSSTLVPPSSTTTSSTLVPPSSTTTSSTLVPPSTTTSTSIVGPTTTSAGGGGNNNNNNNTNNNNNNNSNSNSNSNSNENNNTIVNEITNINVINDDNSNENSNDNDLARGGGGGGGGGHDNGDGDDNGGGGGAGAGQALQVADGSASRGTLARTGSDAGRVTTLAFLALVLGGLFVLGSRGLIADVTGAAGRKGRGRKRGSKREML